MKLWLQPFICSGLEDLSFWISPTKWDNVPKPVAHSFIPSGPHLFTEWVRPCWWCWGHRGRKRHRPWLKKLPSARAKRGALRRWPTRVGSAVMEVIMGLSRTTKGPTHSLRNQIWHIYIYIYTYIPTPIFIYTYMHVCACLVAQSCLTLCDPMDCSPRGSSVHGILQARISEWVAIPSNWGLLHAGRFFTIWATREAPCI